MTVALDDRLKAFEVRSYFSFNPQTWVTVQNMFATVENEIPVAQ